MKNQTGYFEGREHRKLFYQYWQPENNIKAYIITLHSWGAHSDNMKLTAEYLTEKEYMLYSFDLRGHWRNKGDYPGHIDSMDHLQKDLVLFIDFIKKTSNNKKIFIIGQSFGGLLGLLYAISHPDLAGTIIISPLLDLSKEMSIGKKMLKNLSAKFAPEKTIDFKINQKNLTSDLKILREKIADKNKIEVMSAKSVIELMRSMKSAMDHASEMLCPCLILQAGNEKIADKLKTKKFFTKIKSEDKTYKEYDGFLHELLNEKKRAQVYQDIFIWLEKHL